jgi:hypothetical protein
VSRVNVNAIFVGVELFTNADIQEVVDAIQRTRNIYATVGLTVDQVQFWSIPLARARGRENIDDDGEAVALTDEWTVPNHALDVFFVRTYAGSTIGLSRVDGPCDKNAKGMDGSVLAIDETSAITALATAHEIGHYLGLSHDTAPGNLMLPSPAGNLGLLRVDQGNNMRDHCFVF